ncbi:PREDICTED: uncharacterized protein LOC106117270 [Papilio xuthus]|uniref:Uncharacterized protein LOC106117270 n=1 Tax=Papilio xuthus TaxID=66420 RepID=A0AAJ7E8D6_PAPXU|nr:PREDICTED: uncharacterized protein LOC106117270 [Papilio xuthus]
MVYRGILLCLLAVWACGALGGRVFRSEDMRVDNSGSNDIPRRCLEMTTSELPCAGVGEDRLLPHPDDCELFYYCVGDVAICRQCPSGLHFSPTHHVCERAARSGCVSARASHPDQE